MLICSGSNAACDELLDRIVESLGNGEVLRLYAQSHEKRKVLPHIECSNWDKNLNSFIMPALRHIYSYNVVICTLAVAGKLVRANDNSDFRPDHFSHIIIDECACTHETLTMIPIAGKIGYFIKKKKQ